MRDILESIYRQNHPSVHVFMSSGVRWHGELLWTYNRGVEYFYIKQGETKTIINPQFVSTITIPTA